LQNAKQEKFTSLLFLAKYLLSLQWERIEVRENKPVMKDCLGNGGVDRSEPRRSG
jgi:hypothetical protein